MMLQGLIGIVAVALMLMWLCKGKIKPFFGKAKNENENSSNAESGDEE